MTPLVGTFSGSGLTLTLTLTGQNGQYSGSALFEGQTLPVSAQKSGQGIVSGVYVMQGESLPFQARLQGDTLTLTAGGEVYSLTRQADGQLPQGGIEAVQSNQVKNDEWGMRFTVPVGWIARLIARSVGDRCWNSVVFVFRRRYWNAKAIHGSINMSTILSRQDW